MGREEVAEGYPIRIGWSGALVDDEGHPDDIVGRVREVLAVLFPENADAIEREACELLGVKDLREYFRNPRRFFDAHIKRYSKSRRKAPIYWLLQSPKRSYALWLYYHRLDRDTLYRALRLYVEPKVRAEEARLAELRAGQEAAETGSRAARGLSRDLERQEDLLSDLDEFRARLRRAADLNLTPDLDDGVVLTMAPLHELVPWKEPKGYWQELLAGKYEWSSIGRQLREKGLVAE